MSTNHADLDLSSKKLLFGLDIRNPNGIANNLIDTLGNYDFDHSSNTHYDERVRNEIFHGVRDLRDLLARQKSSIIPSSPVIASKETAIHAEDPIARDQAVWALASRRRVDLETLFKSVERAPSENVAVSALLAIQKSAGTDFDRVQAFLAEIASEMSNPSRVNLAEWAALIRTELQACKNKDLSLLQEPISQRTAVHQPGKTFDLTMPLMFQCNALTTIAGVSHQLTISPTWFKQIFGDAMACIRSETFQSQIVLEKNVSGLHEDGSAHYEHFPFTGTTHQLNDNLFMHNYWSQIFRPFYTSGRVEVVRPGQDVIPSVPMTFSRVAVTAAYNKYAVNDVPMPESVRGIFFGYGHIPPRTLLTRGMNLRVGDFQISSRNNPETGKRANTYFYGTFFGKLTDTNSEGQLLLNGRDTHCDKHGALDYSGHGLMDKDSCRPHDWH